MCRSATCNQTTSTLHDGAAEALSASALLTGPGMNMIVSPPRTGAGLIEEQPRWELASALRSCRGAFLGIAAFTAVSNILMLTGSFFMLEVYDRVLPSRSVPTLLGLATLAILLYLVQGM